MKYLAAFALCIALAAVSACSHAAGIPGSLTVLQPDRTESSKSCLITITDNFIAPSCATSGDISIVNEPNDPVTGFSSGWKYGWFQAPPAEAQLRPSDSVRSSLRRVDLVPQLTRQRSNCELLALSVDDTGVNARLYCPPA